MATVEERLTKLEWRLRYQKIVIVLLALFLSVTTGARAWDKWKPPVHSELTSVHSELTCTSLRVVDRQGKALVILSSTEDGDGRVETYSPEGKRLVILGSAEDGDGRVETYSPEGKRLVILGSSENGDGGVWTYTKAGSRKMLD